MSKKGKHSPTIYSANPADYFYNARGETPVEWNREKDYDPETMSADYDSEGFNSYGYSGYDVNGKYVGSCYGVDRDGYTENYYQNMSDEEFDRIFERI
jgi:hypothetical protein